METVVLDSIAFKVDIGDLFKRFRVDEDSDDAKDITRLVKIAEDMGRPRAMYKEVMIDFKGLDYVIAGGIKLYSRILRINLESTDRIFPYICTCGRELDDWARSLDDIMERYWLDQIMELALQRAIKAFGGHLSANYRLGVLSNMNPGSLEDWPINQQEELFALLGDPYRSIGVELTNSFLMLPIKSISGIRFPSTTEFINCQLCPRDVCDNRRADFHVL